MPQSCRAAGDSQHHSPAMVVPIWFLCGVLNIAIALANSAPISAVSPSHPGMVNENAFANWLASLQSHEKTQTASCPSAVSGTVAGEAQCENFMRSVMKLPELVHRLNAVYQPVLVGNVCLQSIRYHQAKPAQSSHEQAYRSGRSESDTRAEAERGPETTQKGRKSGSKASRSSHGQHKTLQKRASAEAISTNDVPIAVPENPDWALKSAPAEAASRDRRPTCVELIDHIKRSGLDLKSAQQLDKAWSDWSQQHGRAQR